MSDDKRKLNKHSTGTVPKVKYTVKYRNNTGQQQFYSERDNLRNLPNNLSSDWLPRRLESNFPRNTQHITYELMDSTMEEPTQNGIYANGTTNSSQTSSSNSRRNSCGTVPKCDNITKYPNKKQIEDKLNQIRDYLHITTSLMSGMKNSEDQNADENEKNNLSSMIEALKDSEAKLNSLLTMGFEENSECLVENPPDRKNDFETSMNRETVRDLQRLKQKGDSRLREARELQERLARGNIANQTRMENNLQEFDLAIAELEEANSRLVDTKGDVNNFQQPDEASNYITEEIEELQNQIQVVHNANEDRKKLIQLLDKRDAELRSQHLELQSKLTELQTKKSQVDHLVAALQNGKEQDEDMGSHVRTIVTMKDKLEKLKDMLAMVESTEVLMRNGTQEEQAVACEIYNKAENFLNKDLAKGNCSNQSQVENHMAFQYENRASPSLNVDRSKLMNKNSRDTRSQSNDSNSKINEKQALQAELRAKKRELEEIMASSSNLNHDVGTDNKSEFSCANSMFDNISGVWTPLPSMQHNQPDSSDRYSSDEGTEDVNEYSEIPSNQQNQTLLPPSAPSSSAGKFSTDRNIESLTQAYEQLGQPYFFRSDGNTRGTTVTSEANSSFSRGSSVSNVGQGGKQNMQKQLELIRSVCDSMLPQPSSSPSNVHQLRNNLTPSPIYSELRPFSSPNPHSMNALNVVNPQADTAWPSVGGQPNVSFPDAANYQSWLTTNTLQTQAFMLNSLNQCCQMLWLQQRELASLRGMVTALQQERLSSPHYNNESQMTSSSNPTMNCSQVEPLQPPIMNQAGPPMNPCSPSLNQCRPMNPKMNSVPSACSLPNINQYNTPPVTVVDPILANQNNLRLMDSTLNNLNVMNNTDHMRNINLATLQSAGDNMTALPGPLWAGHALNNQVPPGNRANNYWDNFRSYSRQNLFSTKSNDGIQNSPIIDRTNNVTPRSTPFEAQNLPKSNSQHLTGSPQENVPQRSCVRPSRRYPNTNIAVVPPDVLNINQNIKNDGFPLTPIQNESRNINESEGSAPGVPTFVNNASRMPRRHSNVVAPSVENLQNPRRRNASNESVNTEGTSRSRLFEELRENVYREVASLISANEARPHFLIQLFRDLQLVSSDPLRLKTLQSIQVLISQSFRNSQNSASQEPSPNQEVPPLSNEFSMQSTVWSPIPPNSVPKNATILEGLLSKKGDVAKVQYIFHEIIPFLNDNDHLTIDQQFLAILKQKILEAKSFKKVVKDSIFQKHFSNVLDHVLGFYNDKLLSSVKMSLLQSVRELLDRELSFMNLIQSSGESQLNDLVAPVVPQNLNLHEVRSQHPVKVETIEAGAAVQIQNGDLAEADQSHVEDDEIEEEGAVGGVLEPPTEQAGNSLDLNNKDSVESPSSTEAFATSTEAESQYQLGLDQVPTRLPMKSKSRSNTPSKDASSKHDGDHQDHMK
ncbi:pericentriolar material 1 protein isoform X2 [Coccinella septempunctata]|uniref:pericentriolar material 1 protein isoform X2 n=1 Tax=Coccinella septempunctata TaxID=41139 RepID=UPI001D05E3AF|nr:pericentriolar material 1 protein isoform X2 [Coccinella septempunctata]